LPIELQRRVFLPLLLLIALPASAQTPREKSPDPAAPAPTVPLSTTAPLLDLPDLDNSPLSLHGWNAGGTISGVHDSVTGWATLFTPAVGYSFNDLFSVDGSIPIYMYRLAESRSTHPKPNEQLVNQRGELGDVVLGFHFQFLPRYFQYTLTGLATAPTGDKEYGLTTGRVTFDISNLFQRTYGRITPTLEIGGGDSTTLVNRTVTKNYTSLGPLAHFMVGVGIELFRGMTFESDAYEQLPIGDQKIYGPSRHGKATVVTGHNVTEDNGFTNALDLPLTGHVTLSGYYNRSLRLHTDVAAIGISWVLRSQPTNEDDPATELFR
jgi:hypothetical protein